MAGLLKSIVKWLQGGNESGNADGHVTRPVQKSATGTTIKVKPVHTTTANEWVKNSTISEPAIPEEKQLESTKVEAPESQPVVTAIDRTVKRERIQTEVGKEDYLLNQIDEFREKAQQLQDLLLSKESKVIELQNIVDEREIKAKELEHILNERQKKADGITDEVARQIDNLIEKVSAKMEEIGEAIEADLENGQNLSEQQMKELKETLESLTAQLDTIKGELSEKVHSENVKCYRNIADLFKSMDDKMDAVKNENEAVKRKMESVHKCTIAVIVLAIINLLGLMALALYELGVFQLF